MSVNAVDSNGNLKRIAGGTLYADAPIGTISPFGGSAIPSGYLLCNGQAVSRTEYSELFAVIGTAFGKGNESTTFNVPDLREAVPKGAGLNAKGAYHYDNDGIALGEFVDDRIKSHAHNVYVRDTGHAHGTDSGNNIPSPNNLGITKNSGGVGWTANPVAGTASNTQSVSANIQVSSKINFGSIDNATTTNGYATNEVKAVGVNYIIKAKQVAAPADFMDAIDDALNEFAKSISLVSVNNSSIVYDKSRIIGGTVTVCASISVPSGNHLVKENAVANVPSLGTASIGYILPCLYRNVGNGAEEPGYAIIQTDGNLYPYYTKTEYNEIRINASYSCKI